MAKSIEQVKAQLQKLYAMMDENSGASLAEVESATKIARKLMLEYKLSEGDFLKKEAKVIKVYTNIMYTSNTNYWIAELANVIAENYCCKAVMGYSINFFTGRIKKEKSVVFMGFEDDANLCAKIMKYAVDCAMSEFKHIDKRMRKEGYSFADMTSAHNAWGNGYARGIREVFEEQNKTDESFAVVLITPEEVEEATGKLRKANFNTNTAYSNARHFDQAAVNGYQKGKEFSTKDKLVG